MGEQVIQRARSIAVRPAVTALVIVKRGANAVISEFPSKGAVLQFHPLAAKKLKLPEVAILPSYNDKNP
jgi:hypothetical protein